MSYHITTSSDSTITSSGVTTITVPSTITSGTTITIPQTVTYNNWSLTPAVSTKLVSGLKEKLLKSGFVDILIEWVLKQPGFLAHLAETSDNEEIIKLLIESNEYSVLENLANNKNLTEDLARLLYEKQPGIAIRSDACPEDLLEPLFRSHYNIILEKNLSPEFLGRVYPTGTSHVDAKILEHKNCPEYLKVLR